MKDTQLHSECTTLFPPFSHSVVGPKHTGGAAVTPDGYPNLLPIEY